MFFKCHYDSILTIRLFLIKKFYRNVEKLLVLYKKGYENYFYHTNFI